MSNAATSTQVEIRLTLSNLKYQYERSVYTFFTLIGDVGGFNGAIVILPTFIMTIYSERMFKSAISEDIPTRKKNRSFANQANTTNSLKEKFRADG